MSKSRQRLSDALAVSCAALTIAAAAFAATAQAADGPATNIESRLARQPKAFWRAFMPEFYGPYDKKAKCWIGRAASKTYCMRPHTFELVQSGKELLLYASVAGSTTADDNDCHACAGNIGLFVLKVGNANMTVRASSDRYIEDGSYGQPTQEDAFHVAKIGKDGAYGWTEDTFWTGQGIAVSRTQVFAIIGDKIRSIGWLPRSYDDSGNCDESKNLSSGEACSDIAFETMFDTDSPHQRFANVILRGTGTLKGKAFSSTFVVPFDEKSFSYVLPQDLPEEALN